MSATNSFETNLLKLIFNATTIASLAQNASATPATDLYISLHTTDPGEAGSQTTGECDFTSYARVAVARTTAGWTVSGDTVSNLAEITFPACTGGTNVITHFGIGLGSTGAGTLLFKGALTNSLAVSNGITPIFAAGDLKVTVD